MKKTKKGENSDTLLLYTNEIAHGTSCHAELDIQGECVSPVLSLQNTLHCEIG